MVISAGIHGNETAPIEILNQLVTDLLAGQLPLAARLLVLLGNPPAIRKGKRYLSNDINRMFGGRYQHYTPSDETRRASTLEQRVMAFFQASHTSERLHYDLHTAIRGPIILALVCYPTSRPLISPLCFVGCGTSNWMLWLCTLQQEGHSPTLAVSAVRQPVVRWS